MSAAGQKLPASHLSSSLEARFGALLESLSDAIVIVNSEGCIVLANAPAEKLFGRAHGELLGRPAEQLLPERLRNRPAKSGKNHSAQRWQFTDADAELFGLRKDGSEFPAEIRFSTLKTEDGTWFVGTIRDLTEQKRLETQLLEKEAALDAASQELQAFSYSVSHDLRAPLRAMDGFASILKKSLGPDIPEATGHALKRIQDNVGKMSKLIEGLLDYSSLTWMALTKKNVNPGELAQNVFNELIIAAPGRRVDCQISKLPACTADVALLRRVFANLFSNALKFTRDKDLALIRVGSREENGEQVYFVRDNGVGFDMEYSGKLFHVFQRLHSPSEFEGTGVGLAIVHRIIHRHGGRVWAEGQVDEGATVYFTLGEATHGNSVKCTNR
ncbi:MAG TPA: ATP-binding protein [Verrucomicrobiae bacterium]|jgi:PAS domain S-box-containing protein|nr:ATP-binding protein [Verrucomicrobiae bacterium]